MAVQKPVFLLYHGSATSGLSLPSDVSPLNGAAAPSVASTANDAAVPGGVSAGDWLHVLWHGLSHDATVAGYITALPLLLMLLSLWVRLPEGLWRRVLQYYFWLLALVAAAVFAIDVELYRHWGFRLDATVLTYLTDPREALASVDLWVGVRQVSLFAAYTALMIVVWGRVARLFDGRPLRPRAAAVWSLGLLLLGGADFLAIRGGTGASVANVSKAYFSANMFLNHAATNPVFSLLASLGAHADYAAQYVFFDEATRARKFAELRANAPDRPNASAPADARFAGSQAQLTTDASLTADISSTVDTPSTTDAPFAATERVLDTTRPNVVLVVLESFARTVMDARVAGRAVMPNLQRLKEEGVWFENFYANSFRTDRGQVAILSGFPAQTRTSIMKLPAKNRNLPSIARSLARAGYATEFVYGGDLNFTDQASYMYATGWQRLTWQKDLRFDAPLTAWGWDDAAMCDWFAQRVIALDAAREPFLAGLLTLSSHPPFDVPYDSFEDAQLNAFAFSDACVGRMIDRLKASPAWDNLLLVLVADHGTPWPETLRYNEPLRHHIPMLWLGGAIAAPRTVGTYASQIDLCATLLGQMSIAHDDFDYSKDVFAPEPPRKFAYYTFNDGFGVVDASGEVVWDATGDRIVTQSAPTAQTATALLDIGRTMLQTTYLDIANR